MSRSLKKGREPPITSADIASKMKNKCVPPSPLLLDIQSLSMTEENMCRYILLRIWLVTNLVSLLLPEPTEDTEKTKRNPVFAS